MRGAGRALEHLGEIWRESGLTSGRGPRRSATGEENPWFLKPWLTFPAIFVGVALSFYALLQTDAILLRGESSPIPGQSGFSLSNN